MDKKHRDARTVSAFVKHLLHLILGAVKVGNLDFTDNLEETNRKSTKKKKRRGEKDNQEQVQQTRLVTTGQ